MQITFSPVRRDDTLTLERQGQALIVNDEVFDFAALPEGDELAAEAINSEWFAGPVRRQDTVLHVTLVLPHGTDAPSSILFPQPLFQAHDGIISLPSQDGTEKDYMQGAD